MHTLPFPTRLAPALLALSLAGCTLGPDFVRPTPATPESWTSWRSDDAALPIPADAGQAPPAQWWLAFNDPTLDELQQRAFVASPDLRTAALLFSQSRTQRASVAAQRGPEVGISSNTARQRESEHGAGTRMIDIMGSMPGINQRLAEPFTLYHAGLDASWELDLWGRVRRSVEAADADIEQHAALLDLAHLSLASEVAQHYLELRTTQRQRVLLGQDIAALEQRTDLLQARVDGGVLDHTDLQRQRAELAALKAQRPPLLAQEAASANQITLLLGQHPGTLQAVLAAAPQDVPTALPDLALGLPSEVALRRPDIRAALARLHRATASIGIAQADLYPSIRLGANFGFQSYLSGELSEWGSRTWSVGPGISLPLFDQGRRRATVQLRQLQQQEAAVEYQKTVLKAWQEIDDALSAYSAEQQQAHELRLRSDAANQAYLLAQARFDGGITDFTVVLDSLRSCLLARRELAASQGRLGSHYVMINKAIGNTPGLQHEHRRPVSE